MDLIESIKKDKAYVKSKLIVKTWEKEFKSKNSRLPSKFDIKEAPAKIKYAYKKYFQLKSAALENSLSICDNDEDNESMLASPEPIEFLENTTLEQEQTFPDETLPALPTGQELNVLLTKSDTSNNVKTVHPFTENLSKKLFQNRKFSLRNPRKLSFQKSTSMKQSNDESINNENSIENNINLLNDEKGVQVSSVSPSKNQSYDLPNFPHTMFTKSPKVRQLNVGWIERATGIVATDSQQSSDTCNKFGIGNLIIPNVKTISSNTNTEAKFNDYVENSESEGEEINKIKPALKKRKIDYTTSMDLTSKNNLKNQENDKERKQIEKLNTEVSPGKKVKKRNETSNEKKASKVLETALTDNTQKPPDINEFVPFGVDKEIVPRHSQVTNFLNSKHLISENKNSMVSLADDHASDKLEKKVRSGTINENFVKINIEKKVFVRGKKNINFSKYKKQQWKNKKALHAGMEFPEAGKISCFKCGETGHMARYCKAHKGEMLLPLDNCEDNDIPTLEDMENFVSQEPKENISISEQLTKSLSYQPTEIPETFLKLLGDTSHNSDVKSIYSNYDQVDSKDLNEVLHMFGHKLFRHGQENAIKRILCGMSTLLILSTGGGKSLCYQLPAYIYSKKQKCITLVISPLVSLMEDQVLNMPEFLKAGCLHTNQPPTQRRKIIQCLKDGEINILLISPEALVSGDNSSGFAGLFKSLPPIAFACIDEAHCVSHWSHNFRPSYLMICRVLREKLNVKCILGLTATASQTTIKSIIDHIDIPDGFNGVITNPALPDNLHLSVSLERDKDRALIAYLSSEIICEYNSIIVYCIRRDECERVAAVIRSCLQESGKLNIETNKRKRKRMSYTAEAYHAGMSAAQRKKIQNNFMNGTLRIIVATVAFGMGINKSDIRCIIHYNMPSSFESYVQEVGRAGRDGLPAKCHVLINNSSNDVDELLKHIYSNSIDRPTVRKLLQKVFIPCDCLKSQNKVSNSSTECKGHEVGIPIDNTVEELDIPSENIATLLCYVELHPKKYIKVLNNAYVMCKISSYGGPQKILEAAKSCRPLAMAYLIESKLNPKVTNSSVLEFNVIEVAAAIGWESGMTKYHLKNLEWLTENGTSKRSHLKIEFHLLGFRIKARGDLNSSELDSILDELHSSVQFQEKVKLFQLQECNIAFKTLGNYSLENINVQDQFVLQKSDELKNTIRSYFQREDCIPANVELEKRPLDTDRAVNDIRALIASYKDCTFSGRSIAKIFQGISSPNFPAIVWGRCKFWRLHIHEDFNELVKLATQQIISMKL